MDVPAFFHPNKYKTASSHGIKHLDKRISQAFVRDLGINHEDLLTDLISGFDFMNDAKSENADFKKSISHTSKLIRNHLDHRNMLTAQGLLDESSQNEVQKRLNRSLKVLRSSIEGMNSDDIKDVSQIMSVPSSAFYWFLEGISRDLALTNNLLPSADPRPTVGSKPYTKPLEDNLKAFVAACFISACPPSELLLGQHKYKTLLHHQSRPFDGGVGGNPFKVKPSMVRSSVMKTIENFIENNCMYTKGETLKNYIENYGNTRKNGIHQMNDIPEYGHNAINNKNSDNKIGNSNFNTFGNNNDKDDHISILRAVLFSHSPPSAPLSLASLAASPISAPASAPTGGVAEAGKVNGTDVKSDSDLNIAVRKETSNVTVVSNDPNNSLNTSTSHSNPSLPSSCSSSNVLPIVLQLAAATCSRVNDFPSFLECPALIAPVSSSCHSDGTNISKGTEMSLVKDLLEIIDVFTLIEAALIIESVSSSNFISLSNEECDSQQQNPSKRFYSSAMSSLKSLIEYLPKIPTSTRALSIAVLPHLFIQSHECSSLNTGGNLLNLKSKTNHHHNPHLTHISSSVAVRTAHAIKEAASIILGRCFFSDCIRQIIADRSLVDADIRSYFTASPNSMEDSVADNVDIKENNSSSADLNSLQLGPVNDEDFDMYDDTTIEGNSTRTNKNKISGGLLRSSVIDAQIEKYTLHEDGSALSALSDPTLAIIESSQTLLAVTQATASICSNLLNSAVPNASLKNKKLNRSSTAVSSSSTNVDKPSQTLQDTSIISNPSTAQQTPLTLNLHSSNSSINLSNPVSPSPVWSSLLSCTVRTIMQGSSISSVLAPAAGAALPVLATRPSSLDFCSRTIESLSSLLGYCAKLAEILGDKTSLCIRNSANATMVPSSNPLKLGPFNHADVNPLTHLISTAPSLRDESQRVIVPPSGFSKTDIQPQRHGGVTRSSTPFQILYYTFNLTGCSHFRLFLANQSSSATSHLSSQPATYAVYAGVWPMSTSHPPEWACLFPKNTFRFNQPSKHLVPAGLVTVVVEKYSPALHADNFHGGEDDGLVLAFAGASMGLPPQVVARAAVVEAVDGFLCDPLKGVGGDIADSKRHKKDKTIKPANGSEIEPDASKNNSDNSTVPKVNDNNSSQAPSTLVSKKEFKPLRTPSLIHSIKTSLSPAVSSLLCCLLRGPSISEDEISLRSLLVVGNGFLNLSSSTHAKEELHKNIKHEDDSKSSSINQHQSPSVHSITESPVRGLASYELRNLLMPPPLAPSIPVSPLHQSNFIIGSSQSPSFTPLLEGHKRLHNDDEQHKKLNRKSNHLLNSVISPSPSPIILKTFEALEILSKDSSILPIASSFKQTLSRIRPLGGSQMETAVRAQFISHLHMLCLVDLFTSCLSITERCTSENRLDALVEDLKATVGVSSCALLAIILFSTNYKLRPFIVAQRHKYLRAADEAQSKITVALTPPSRTSSPSLKPVMSPQHSPQAASLPSPIPSAALLEDLESELHTAELRSTYEFWSNISVAKSRSILAMAPFHLISAAASKRQNMPASSAAAAAQSLAEYNLTMDIEDSVFASHQGDSKNIEHQASPVPVLSSSLNIATTTTAHHIKRVDSSPVTPLKKRPVLLLQMPGRLQNGSNSTSKNANSNFLNSMSNASLMDVSTSNNNIRQAAANAAALALNQQIMQSIANNPTGSLLESSPSWVPTELELALTFTVFSSVLTCQTHSTGTEGNQKDSSFIHPSRNEMLIKNRQPGVDRNSSLFLAPSLLKLSPDHTALSESIKNSASFVELLFLFKTPDSIAPDNLLSSLHVSLRRSERRLMARHLALSVLYNLLPGSLNDSFISIPLLRALRSGGLESPLGLPINLVNALMPLWVPSTRADQFENGKMLSAVMEKYRGSVLNIIPVPSGAQFFIKEASAARKALGFDMMMGCSHLDVNSLSCLILEWRKLESAILAQLRTGHSASIGPRCAAMALSSLVMVGRYLPGGVSPCIVSLSLTSLRDRVAWLSASHSKNESIVPCSPPCDPPASVSLAASPVDIQTVGNNKAWSSAPPISSLHLYESSKKSKRICDGISLSVVPTWTLVMILDICFLSAAWYKQNHALTQQFAELESRLKQTKGVISPTLLDIQQQTSHAAEFNANEWDLGLNDPHGSAFTDTWKNGWQFSMTELLAILHDSLIPILSTIESDVSVQKDVIRSAEHCSLIDLRLIFINWLSFASLKLHPLFVLETLSDRVASKTLHSLILSPETRCASIIIRILWRLVPRMAKTGCNITFITSLMHDILFGLDDNLPAGVENSMNLNGQENQEAHHLSLACKDDTFTFLAGSLRFPSNTSSSLNVSASSATSLLISKMLVTIGGLTSIAPPHLLLNKFDSAKKNDHTPTVEGIFPIYPRRIFVGRMTDIHNQVMSAPLSILSSKINQSCSEQKQETKDQKSQDINNNNLRSAPMCSWLAADLTILLRLLLSGRCGLNFRRASLERILSAVRFNNHKDKINAASEFETNAKVDVEERDVFSIEWLESTGALTVLGGLSSEILPGTLIETSRDTSLNPSLLPPDDAHANANRSQNQASTNGMRGVCVNVDCTSVCTDQSILFCKISSDGTQTAKKKKRLQLCESSIEDSIAVSWIDADAALFGEKIPLFGSSDISGGIGGNEGDWTADGAVWVDYFSNWDDTVPDNEEDDDEIIDSEVGEVDPLNLNASGAVISQDATSKSTTMHYKKNLMQHLPTHNQLANQSLDNQFQNLHNSMSLNTSQQLPILSGVNGVHLHSASCGLISEPPSASLPPLSPFESRNAFGFPSLVGVASGMFNSNTFDSNGLVTPVEDKAKTVAENHSLSLSIVDVLLESLSSVDVNINTYFDQNKLTSLVNSSVIHSILPLSVLSSHENTTSNRFINKEEEIEMISHAILSCISQVHRRTLLLAAACTLLRNVRASRALNSRHSSQSLIQLMVGSALTPRTSLVSLQGHRVVSSLTSHLRLLLRDRLAGTIPSSERILVKEPQALALKYSPWHNQSTLLPKGILLQPLNDSSDMSTPLLGGANGGDATVVRTVSSVVTDHGVSHGACTRLAERGAGFSWRDAANQVVLGGSKLVSKLQLGSNLKSHEDSRAMAMGMALAGEVGSTKVPDVWMLRECADAMYSRLYGYLQRLKQTETENDSEFSDLSSPGGEGDEDEDSEDHEGNEEEDEEEVHTHHRGEFDDSNNNAEDEEFDDMRAEETGSYLRSGWVGRRNQVEREGGGDSLMLNNTNEDADDVDEAAVHMHDGYMPFHSGEVPSTDSLGDNNHLIANTGDSAQVDDLMDSPLLSFLQRFRNLHNRAGTLHGIIRSFEVAGGLDSGENSSSNLSNPVVLMEFHPDDEDDPSAHHTTWIERFEHQRILPPPGVSFMATTYRPEQEEEDEDEEEEEEAVIQADGGAEHRTAHVDATQALTSDVTMESNLVESFQESSGQLPTQPQKRRKSKKQSVIPSSSVATVGPMFRGWSDHALPSIVPLSYVEVHISLPSSGDSQSQNSSKRCPLIGLGLSRDGDWDPFAAPGVAGSMAIVSSGHFWARGGLAGRIASFGVGDVIGLGYFHNRRSFFATLNGEFLNPVHPDDLSSAQIEAFSLQSGLDEFMAGNIKKKQLDSPSVFLKPNMTPLINKLQGKYRLGIWIEVGKGLQEVEIKFNFGATEKTLMDVNDFLDPSLIKEYDTRFKLNMIDAVHLADREARMLTNFRGDGDNEVPNSKDQLADTTDSTNNMSLPIDDNFVQSSFNTSFGAHKNSDVVMMTETEMHRRTLAEDLHDMMGGIYPLELCVMSLERSHDNPDVAIEWLLEKGQHEMERMMASNLSGGLGTARGLVSNQSTGNPRSSSLNFNPATATEEEMLAWALEESLRDVTNNAGAGEGGGGGSDPQQHDEQLDVELNANEDEIFDSELMEALRAVAAMEAREADERLKQEEKKKREEAEAEIKQLELNQRHLKPGKKQSSSSRHNRKSNDLQDDVNMHSAPPSDDDDEEESVNFSIRDALGEAVSILDEDPHRIVNTLALDHVVHPIAQLPSTRNTLSSEIRHPDELSPGMSVQLCLPDVSADAFFCIRCRSSDAEHSWLLLPSRVFSKRKMQNGNYEVDFISPPPCVMTGISTLLQLSSCITSASVSGVVVSIINHLPTPLSLAASDTSIRYAIVEISSQLGYRSLVCVPISWLNIRPMPANSVSPSFSLTRTVNRLLALPALDLSILDPGAQLIHLMLSAESAFSASLMRLTLLRSLLAASAKDMSLSILSNDALLTLLKLTVAFQGPRLPGGLLVGGVGPHGSLLALQTSRHLLIRPLLMALSLRLIADAQEEGALHELIADEMVSHADNCLWQAYEQKIIETSHPYKLNHMQKWNIIFEGCSSMVLSFEGKVGLASDALTALIVGKDLSLSEVIARFDSSLTTNDSTLKRTIDGPECFVRLSTSSTAAEGFKMVFSPCSVRVSDSAALLNKNPIVLFLLQVAVCSNSNIFSCFFSKKDALVLDKASRALRPRSAQARTCHQAKVICRLLSSSLRPPVSILPPGVSPKSLPEFKRKTLFGNSLSLALVHTSIGFLNELTPNLEAVSANLNEVRLAGDIESCVVSTPKLPQTTVAHLLAIKLQCELIQNEFHKNKPPERHVASPLPLRLTIDSFLRSSSPLLPPAHASSLISSSLSLPCAAFTSKSHSIPLYFPSLRPLLLECHIPESAAATNCIDTLRKTLGALSWQRRKPLVVSVASHSKLPPASTIKEDAFLSRQRSLQLRSALAIARHPSVFLPDDAQLLAMILLSTRCAPSNQPPISVADILGPAPPSSRKLLGRLEIDSLIDKFLENNDAAAVHSQSNMLSISNADKSPNISTLSSLPIPLVTPASMRPMLSSTCKDCNFKNSSASSHLLPIHHDLSSNDILVTPSLDPTLQRIMQNTNPNTQESLSASVTAQFFFDATHRRRRIVKAFIAGIDVTAFLDAVYEIYGPFRYLPKSNWISFISSSRDGTSPQALKAIEAVQTLQLAVLDLSEHCLMAEVEVRTGPISCSFEDCLLVKSFTTCFSLKNDVCYDLLRSPPIDATDNSAALLIATEDVIDCSIHHLKNDLEHKESHFDIMSYASSSSQSDGVFTLKSAKESVAKHANHLAETAKCFDITLIDNLRWLLLARYPWSIVPGRLHLPMKGPLELNRPLNTPSVPIKMFFWMWIDGPRVEDNSLLVPSSSTDQSKSDGNSDALSLDVTSVRMKMKFGQKGSGTTFKSLGDGKIETVRHYLSLLLLSNGAEGSVQLEVLDNRLLFNQRDLFPVPYEQWIPLTIGFSPEGTRITRVDSKESHLVAHITSCSSILIGSLQHTLVPNKVMLPTGNRSATHWTSHTGIIAGVTMLPGFIDVNESILESATAPFQNIYDQVLKPVRLAAEELVSIRQKSTEAKITEYRKEKERKRDELVAKLRTEWQEAHSKKKEERLRSKREYHQMWLEDRSSRHNIDEDEVDMQGGGIPENPLGRATTKKQKRKKRQNPNQQESSSQPLRRTNGSSSRSNNNTITDNNHNNNENENLSTHPQQGESSLLPTASMDIEQGLDLNNDLRLESPLLPIITHAATAQNDIIVAGNVATPVSQTPLFETGSHAMPSSSNEDSNDNHSSVNDDDDDDDNSSSNEESIDISSVSKSSSSSVYVSDVSLSSAFHSDVALQQHANRRRNNLLNSNGQSNNQNGANENCTHVEYDFIDDDASSVYSFSSADEIESDDEALTALFRMDDDDEITELDGMISARSVPHPILFKSKTASSSNSAGRKSDSTKSIKREIRKRRKMKPIPTNINLDTSNGGTTEKSPLPPSIPQSKTSRLTSILKSSFEYYDVKNLSVPGVRFSSWAHFKNWPLVSKSPGWLLIQAISTNTRNVLRESNPFISEHQVSSFLFTLPPSLIKWDIDISNSAFLATLRIQDALSTIDPRLLPCLASLPSPVQSITLDPTPPSLIELFNSGGGISAFAPWSVPSRVVDEILMTRTKFPLTGLVSGSNMASPPVHHHAENVSPGSVKTELFSGDLPLPSKEILTIIRANSFVMDKHFVAGMPLLIASLAESTIPSCPLQNILFSPSNRLAILRRGILSSGVRRDVVSSIIGSHSESSTLSCKISRPKAQHSFDKNEDEDGIKSVLGQLFEAVGQQPGSFFKSRERLVRVSYLGEGGIDVGGLYRDLFTHIVTSELQGAPNAIAAQFGSISRFRFLIPTPNSRSALGDEQDSFILSPFSFQSSSINKSFSHTRTDRQLDSIETNTTAQPQSSEDPSDIDSSANNQQSNHSVDSTLLQFIGKLLGTAFIQDLALPLNLSYLVWLGLLGIPATLSDLQRCDANCANLIKSVAAATSDKDLEELGNPVMAIQSVDPRLPPHALIKDGFQIKVTTCNKDLFVKKALQFKLKEELAAPISALASGLSMVISRTALRLILPAELEIAICGNRDVNVAALKRNTRVNPEMLTHNGDNVIKWLWEILEEMSTAQRESFLRFTWGRSRLPISFSSLAPARREESLEINPAAPRRREIPSLAQQEAYYAECEMAGLDVESEEEKKRPWVPSDSMLPTSATCFFTLSLPKYSRKGILRRKLLYALSEGVAIDTDNQVGGAGWDLDE